MPAMYYIYAGSRWCEIDTRLGRVAGFRQRARFCYVRGGKLVVGRTAAVLRALRALATGTGGAARDSAPLLAQRPHRARRENIRAHRCCSQHLHHSRCDLNANEVSEKPPIASPRKRKISTSEDSPKIKQSRSETQNTPIKEKQCQTSPQLLKRKEEVHSLLSSEDEEERQKIQTPQKKKKVLVRDKEQELIHKLQSSEVNAEQKKAKISPKKTVAKSPVEMIKRLPPKSTQKKTDARREELEDKLVHSLLHSSSEDNVQVSPKTQPKPAAKKAPESSSSSSEGSDRREACKELVIDDSDVRVLRGFLARGAGGEDLERFDRDEEYKTRVFYKLNPLVLLKRCGPLEKLLLQRLTLKEFARHLGLRSVADVTPEKRYRMRHSTRQARNVSVTSESERENVAQPKRRQLWNRDKEIFDSVQSSRSSELIVKPQIHRVQDSSEDASDSDTEVKKHIKKHLERRASARNNPRREKQKHKSNKENNDSIVVENTSESSAKEKIGKSKRKGEEESVVVSDESDRDVIINRRKSKNNDEGRGRSRRRTRGMKDESLVVSDDNDDEVDGKARTRSRKKSNIADDNVSVVISDDNSSSSDENSDDNKVKTTRKTRSQGPEKRALRERNKSVVISDDTDSSSNRNLAKSRIETKEKAKAQNSDVVSDDSISNTDEQKPRRPRSKGPDRALKEQNRTDSNVTKESNKAKTEVNNTTESKRTRLSMRGIEGGVKERNKEDASKRDEQTKSKENKAGPSSKGKDASVISDSEDAFETPKLSPKKNKKDLTEPKRLSSTNLPRNNKGRFLKRKEIKSSEDQKEEHKGRKVNKGLKEKNKTNEKQTTGNETDKEKNRQKERDRMHKDNKENSQSSPNKRKEIDRKAAVARSMLIKPVKFKKSSVANGREYTSLEDHAIVAWVSVGSRERMVNGNAIWRELEADYERLTSQKRTWHSLRNRYLRYILPALGALALPPAQVSRLRAAAAQGKIKHQISVRRNSIFSAPRVRSAAAAGRLQVKPVTVESDSDKDISDADEDKSDAHKKEHAPAAPAPRRSLRGAPAPAPAPAPAAASPHKKRRIHHL